MNICFIDFETTGINVFNDEPIELGAVLIDNEFNMVNSFSSYIRPSFKKEVSKNAYKIHNIKLLDLKSAPLQKEVINSFFLKLGFDFCFGGWNISFDVSFMRKICHDSNFMDLYNKVSYKHIDVQTISRIYSEFGLLPNSVNSLSDLISFFNLERNEKHNALEDAVLTSKVYINLMNLLKKIL